MPGQLLGDEVFGIEAAGHERASDVAAGQGMGPNAFGLECCAKPI